mgnify:CR=1 FL=1
MANPRPKVLIASFAMLATASVLLIWNEGAVGAKAWALLALTGVIAAAAVMGFLQQDSVENSGFSETMKPHQSESTDAQTLPDPAEDGFDVPVV